MNYYFSVVYPPQRFNGPWLGIVLPESDILLQRFLNELQASDAHLPMLISDVLDGKINEYTYRLNNLTEAVISADTVMINEVDYDGSILQSSHIKTTDFHQIVRLLLDAIEEFKMCRLSGTPWHGIPMKVNVEELDKSYWLYAKYWDPNTNQVGYIKDTPEGSEWAKKAKELEDQKSA